MQPHKIDLNEEGWFCGPKDMFLRWPATKRGHLVRLEGRFEIDAMFGHQPHGTFLAYRQNSDHLLLAATNKRVLNAVLNGAFWTYYKPISFEPAVFVE